MNYLKFAETIMRVPAGFVRDIGGLILEPDLKVWLNCTNSNFNIEKKSKKHTEYLPWQRDHIPKL